MKIIVSAFRIKILAIICLTFTIIVQLLLIVDYFQASGKYFIRESDDILKEAFRKDIESRRNIYRLKIGIKPGEVENEEIQVEERYASYQKHFPQLIMPELTQLAYNRVISKSVPQDLNTLKETTAKILLQRNIDCKFEIRYVNLNKSVPEEKHKTDSSFYRGLLNINSGVLVTSIVNECGIQLCLKNPYGGILKRILLFVLGSLILLVSSCFAFKQILKLLKYKEELMTFKNDYLQTIAHELGRPVNALSAELQMMNIKADENNRNINHLLSIVEDLDNIIVQITNLYKANEGLLRVQICNIPLAEMLQELKMTFEDNPRKKVLIQIELQKDITNLHADRVMLRQCFYNLIDNAIKYSGRSVTIYIRVCVFDQCIVLKVKDNGLGISAKKLPEIFNKHYRAHTDLKINGYGIGLFYVKTIIELHNGSINVKSKPGKGTEFIIHIPLDLKLCNSK